MDNHVVLPPLSLYILYSTSLLAKKHEALVSTLYRSNIGVQTTTLSVVSIQNVCRYKKPKMNVNVHFELKSNNIFYTSVTCTSICSTRRLAP